MHDNPYQPSMTDSLEARSSENSPSPDPDREWILGENPRPAVSPIGTTMARHIAAILDNMVSAVLSVVAAKQLPDDWVGIQIAAATIVYFGYYFVFESLFATSPGKLLTGLKILSFDGKRCSMRQIAVRTLLRMVEVNPLLLGGLPAAARILMTRDKQRFGDKLAGTIVVYR